MAELPPPAPFIHAVEVWVPDGEVLKRASAAYGSHTQLGHDSASITFRKGEGLPGSVWSSGRAHVRQALQANFVRADLARDAGLDAGAAFPVVCGDVLSAVVVLLCGSREHSGGGIELWEPNDVRELQHAGGYYGNLTSFGDLSRLIRFQAGRGMPGIAWQTGLPHIVEDTGNSNSFLRASAARECGVRAALGLPLFQGEKVVQVLGLLSAHDTPLAQAFECWVPEPAGGFKLHAAYRRVPDVADVPVGGICLLAGSSVASVFESRIPMVVDHAEHGFEAAIPICDAARVRALVRIIG